MRDILIEEVRELRRQVVAAAGGDMNVLGQQLKQIELEFQTRTGRFAGVPLKLDAELFPTMTKLQENFAVEEVRSLRSRPDK